MRAELELATGLQWISRNLASNRLLIPGKKWTSLTMHFESLIVEETYLKLVWIRGRSAENMCKLSEKQFPHIFGGIRDLFGVDCMFQWLTEISPA